MPAGREYTDGRQGAREAWRGGPGLDGRGWDAALCGMAIKSAEAVPSCLERVSRARGCIGDSGTFHTRKAHGIMKPPRMKKGTDHLGIESSQKSYLESVTLKPGSPGQSVSFVATSGQPK